MGGISKANRLSLKMAKTSSKLKVCPCKDKLCTFPYFCPSFIALDLPKKNAFLTEQSLCGNCLINHGKVQCKYDNRHSCSSSNDKNKHHWMLCPESKKTKVTAGLTRFTCLNIERPDIKIVTSLLDDLDICPSQFLEEVGNNLDIEEFDPSDDEGAYSESSDSEGQNTGGLFYSKENQEPRKICSNCRQVCKGCQSDEDLGLPSSFEQESAYRD